LVYKYIIKTLLIKQHKNISSIYNARKTFLLTHTHTHCILLKTLIKRVLGHAFVQDAKLPQKRALTNSISFHFSTSLILFELVIHVALWLWDNTGHVSPYSPTI